MKHLLIAITALVLSNCNTMIGLGRDTKEGFMWCSRKISEASQNRGGGDTGGGGYDEAPIY
jgi:predicted small secreted protein